MVAQSLEPGAHDKNTRPSAITLQLSITIFAKINLELKYKIFIRPRLFTITLLLTITIFAKIKSELKYKIFLRATSPKLKIWVRKCSFYTDTL